MTEFSREQVPSTLGLGVAAQQYAEAIHAGEQPSNEILEIMIAHANDRDMSLELMANAALSTHPRS